VSEDWAAVATAITERLLELGWQQRELAERSHVSPATIREIQRHTVERRRSPRTLESLSVSLGWSPDYLSELLIGAKPVNGQKPHSTLESLDNRLREITQILYDLKADVATLIKHVRDHSQSGFRPPEE
jgi:transcriptional regulator with XRE-family HTH domain